MRLRIDDVCQNPAAADGAIQAYEKLLSDLLMSVVY
jgi:hypothetical protein